MLIKLNMMKQIQKVLTLLLCILSTAAIGQKKAVNTPTLSNFRVGSVGIPSRTVKTLSDTLLSPAKISREDSNTINLIADLFEMRAKGSNGVKLNPRAVSFVKDYMESHTRELLRIRDFGLPYFNMMDGVFRQHGLPVELKYLAVIESELKASATSKMGAVGPWQLMPSTARLLGLKVTRNLDERKDFNKSTHAAAKYLKELYGEFGDWLLTIAAYNGGPSNVYSAIKKSGSRNFWLLQKYLPNESRIHVKKFIGTHYILEGQGGVTTLTKSETADQLHAVSQLISSRKISQEEMSNLKSVRISGKYHSSVIARILSMEPETFNRFNPNFDKVMAGAENTYDLKLPSEKMDSFVANKYQILMESVQFLLNESVSVSVTEKKR